ncbi:KIR protein [Plasmodium coatneyi]|uniref:KIR protein n=1 Tax=Plasmodium coatneyi TaxID=208452 RepID=A0A1B1E649_9APIC|nr:KIR protein [Plasmodium coatneyi]ANQ10447.1 KIR protein [Plasmodium coatneyi]
MDDPSLNQLPSEQRYALLNDGLKCHMQQGRDDCCKHNGDNLRIISQVWLGNDINLGKEIEQRYCYACKMKQREPNGEWCHFFYYWLGDKIRGKLNYRLYRDIMKPIYHGLDKLSTGNKCTNIYDDIGDYIFEQSRIFFDCYYNNSALRGKLDSSTHTQCKKYNEQLVKVKSAYEKLCEQCKDSGDKYCEQFRRTEVGCETQNLQPLTCPEEETVSDRDSPDDDDESHEVLGGEKLEGVNSALKYYDELDIGADSCDNDNILDTMKELLKQHIVYDTPADKIVRGWCSAFERRDRSISISEYSHALYYWIGGILLSGQWNVYDLADLMKELYQELERWKPIAGCNNIYPNITKDIFNERKQIFEYLQEYNTMKEQLTKRTGSPSTPIPKCTKAYADHLKEVIDALTKEHTKCSGPDKGDSDPYCTDFLKMCQQCTPQELSNLKCEVPKELEHQTTQTEDSTTSSSSTGDVPPSGMDSTTTTTTIAIPSILGAVGMPTIVMFLLYKVQL